MTRGQAKARIEEFQRMGVDRTLLGVPCVGLSGPQMDGLAKAILVFHAPHGRPQWMESLARAGWENLVYGKHVFVVAEP